MNNYFALDWFDRINYIEDPDILLLFANLKQLISLRMSLRAYGFVYSHGTVSLTTSHTVVAKDVPVQLVGCWTAFRQDLDNRESPVVDGRDT